MKIILPILFILTFTFQGFSQQVSKNFIDENYIEVTGKAEMEITPNQIYLKVIISEKDNKGKVSIDILEKQMIEKLEGINIDIDKQLTVNDMASNFKFYWTGKTDIFTAKEFQVLVSDAMTAGKVFQELESIGISNISISKLDHTEIEKYRQQVKVEAIKAAKVKAQALASAIDQEIGKALYIKERETPSYPNTTSNIIIRGSSSFKASGVQMPKVEFGKINLSYEVSACFKLN
ncbi:SIMPL domain-containing protein [Limibacter armeniacum]|uniref:SIMPL domain-containing protein n=1 Tax=Limibacter armeniacum TaxID=466084 RepID=UPI002FE56795